MSKPSFENIDLWLFELAEGNLTPSQIERLEVFLMQNPELDLERDVWEMAKVDSAAAVYDEKERLTKRKPIGWYYAIGSTAVVALITMSAIYFTGSSTDNPGLESANIHQESIKKKLNDEINAMRVNHRMESEKLQIVREKLAEANNLLQNVEKNEASSVSSNRNDVAEQSNSSNAPKTENKGQDYIPSHESNVSNFENRTINGNNNAISGLNLNALENIEEENIERYLLVDPVKEIDVLEESEYAQLVRPANKTYGIIGSDYKVSFKSKFNKFTRALQRMVDNPIALSNYRDPYYHVPGMLPNDVNFSSTGTMLSTRVQAISRLQWYGQENEQLISQLAIDGYAYGMRGGVGLQINHAMYNDGGMNIASAALTYSPKISLSKSVSLEPSLRFKMGNKSLNKTMMADVDMVELDRNNAHEFFANGQTPNGNDLWFKDLGAGLMINTEWFFVGAQFDNLFHHRDNIYSVDIENPRTAATHFIGTIGTDWMSKRKDLSLSPYMVYQKMENLSEAWLGANLKVNWFTFGAAVSSDYDPSASIGVKFKHFAMTYNADYTSSEMIGGRALSHQVSLRFVSKPSRFGRRLLNM